MSSALQRISPARSAVHLAAATSGRGHAAGRASSLGRWCEWCTLMLVDDAAATHAPYVSTAVCL
eukprot:6252149-Prymnesium_polylepis.1